MREFLLLSSLFLLGSAQIFFKNGGGGVAGRKVEEVEEEDPTLTGGVFEGDITNVDPESFYEGDGGLRNAVRSSGNRWPGGRIPYVISKTKRWEREMIEKAMQEFHEKTCLRFVPRSNENNYVNIIDGNFCRSAVGRWGVGMQTLELGPGCMNHGTIVHELMHTAGFFHEQSRADRDDYVTIIWDNIEEGIAKNNFKKYSLREIDHLGAEYDYCSIMHYPDWAFKRRYDLKTIKMKRQSKCTIGQRIKLSDTDMRKINTLYQCSGYPQVQSAGGSRTCSDSSKGCKWWAFWGYCFDPTYTNYMLTNCPVSCNQQCDYDRLASNGERPPKPTKNEEGDYDYNYDQYL